VTIHAYNPANSRVYTGLSTDTKPTGASIGDKFIEVDTKTLYMYLGVSGWVELGTIGGTGPIGAVL
jgi:hypothetical protein